MTLTAAQIAKLNKSNRAMQEPSVGTLLGTFETDIAALEALGIVRGSHTVTAAQATASSISIGTALSSVSGYVIQAYRSGCNIDFGGYVTGSSGSLVIRATGSFVVTGSDVINYIAW